MKLFFLHILSFVHSLSRLEPLQFEEFDQRKLNSKFLVFSRPFCSILISMSHFRKWENSKVFCIREINRLRAQYTFLKVRGTPKKFVLCTKDHSFYYLGVILLELVNCFFVTTQLGFVNERDYKTWSLPRHTCK